MAKLSARGRQELARYKKSEVKNDAYHEANTINTHIAIMDDGMVLRKINWTGYPGTWNQYKKLKKDTLKKGEKATLENFKGFISVLEKNGYVRI